MVQGSFPPLKISGSALQFARFISEELSPGLVGSLHLFLGLLKNTFKPILKGTGISRRQVSVPHWKLRTYKHGLA